MGVWTEDCVYGVRNRVDGWVGGGVMADGKTARGMCSWKYLVLLK